MASSEISIPKEIREFMPDKAEETFLGQKNGAKKQYRYGNLHIREYDDNYLVHNDTVDPRQDPLGHLKHDAPEVLVGVVCSVAGFAYSRFKNKNSLTDNIVSSLVAGYLGYTITKKIKDYKR